MFHECEAAYPRLDQNYVEDARFWPRPTWLASVLHLLGFGDV